MPDEMTEGQYRALVAYLSYWETWSGCTLAQAKEDIGIDCDDESIIDQLSKCGWDYDKTTRRIRYGASETLDQLLTSLPKDA
jgi:hypothetical protein